MLGQLVQGELPPAGQDVGGGGNEQQVLLEEHLHGGVGIVDGEVDHGEVDGAGHQLGYQRGGVALEDRHLDPRVAARHGIEERGEQPAPGGADHPQADVAGHLVAHRAHVGHEGVELGLDAPSPSHHRFTLSGQPPAGPVDEGGPELALQAGDMGRDVRLHRVQPAGGGRERSCFGHRHQCRQLPEVHR